MKKNNTILPYFPNVQLLFLFSIMLTGSLWAQPSVSFTEAVNKFKADPLLKHASWSICIKKPGDKGNLFAHNEQLSLTPASTLKVLTTTTALDILGEKFTFKTYIGYQGKIENGILKGNLLIIGNGDPTLESEYFKSSQGTLDKVYSVIEKAGIKKVDGNIIADVSRYDDAPTPVNWLWADIGNYYGAGPGAINYKDNKLYVYFKSGTNAGDTTIIVKTTPEIEGLKLVNQVRTGAAGSGDNAYFYGAEYQNLRVIKGTIPPKKEAFDVASSIPDPALLLCQDIKKHLIQKGTEVSGEASTTRILSYYGLKHSLNNTVLDSLQSPPLGEIIYFTNIKSLNLFAEGIMKNLATIKSPVANNTDGLKVIETFMKANNISTEGLKLHDGSGLSPMNKITTQTQVDILCHAYKKPFFNTLQNSFPVAGKSGSLASMFKGTTAEGKIMAKSGYIGGVRSYTGYFVNAKGEKITFSFIVNNFDGSASEIKKKMEALMVAMVDGF